MKALGWPSFYLAALVGDMLRRPTTRLDLGLVLAIGAWGAWRVVGQTLTAGIKRK